MNDFSEQEKDSFYKAVYSRRDVRSNFTSEPIDEQVLTRILKAAHHAPSVGFSQPWNFILIKNIETRKKIKESFEKEKARSSKLVEEPKRSKYLSYKLEGILESAINLCVHSIKYSSSGKIPFGHNGQSGQVNPSPAAEIYPPITIKE